MITEGRVEILGGKGIIITLWGKRVAPGVLEISRLISVVINVGLLP